MDLVQTPGAHLFSKAASDRLRSSLALHLGRLTHLGALPFSRAGGRRFLDVLLNSSDARSVQWRGFWLVVLMNCTPFLSIRFHLLTIDPLLVFFWTAAMLTVGKPAGGWQAESVGWVGLDGIRFPGQIQRDLSDPLLPPLLRTSAVPTHLRKPGPYLALIIALITCGHHLGTRSTTGSPSSTFPVT